MTISNALTGMELILGWFVLDVVWNVSLNILADYVFRDDSDDSDSAA